MFHANRLLTPTLVPAIRFHGIGVNFVVKKIIITSAVETVLSMSTVKSH